MWQRIKEWWQQRKDRKQNKRLTHAVKDRMDKAPERKRRMKRRVM